MATHTQKMPARPYWWQHGTRPVNTGYPTATGRKVSFVGMRYETYQQLHLLASSLTKGTGKRVSLANALHHAVAQANRHRAGE